MVSFQLGKEIKKDVLCLVTSMGQRKNSESPHEDLNLKPLDSVLRCKVYYEVHMTCILHTARISNVDSVTFVDRNKRDGKF